MGGITATHASAIKVVNFSFTSKEKHRSERRIKRGKEYKRNKEKERKERRTH